MYNALYTTCTVSSLKWALRTWPESVNMAESLWPEPWVSSVSWLPACFQSSLSLYLNRYQIQVSLLASILALYCCQIVAFEQKSKNTKICDLLFKLEEMNLVILVIAIVCCDVKSDQARSLKIKILHISSWQLWEKH